MIKKIKKFFTDKPEGNIWKRLCMYLIIFNYIGVFSMILIIPLLAGLAVPGQEMDFHNVSQELAITFENNMDTLYNAGANIATNNPILSKVLFFVIANAVYVFYAGIFLLFIDIIGTVSTWVYQKYNRKKYINNKNIKEKEHSNKVLEGGKTNE